MNLNPKSLFLAATLVGGLVSTASATTLALPESPVSPVPVRIVAPVHLPRSHLGAIVTLRLTVDASGRPQNIQLVSDRDEALSRSLVAAVSQWQFTPARRHGTPVSVTIELPLELIED